MIAIDFMLEINKSEAHMLSIFILVIMSLLQLFDEV